MAHLGDTTGVVTDGAVAVDGEADGEGGEHAEGGHGDTVLGGKLEGDAHGGGEGKTSGGRHPVSPWGKAEGRTRKPNKPSDKLIVRRRRTGKNKR